jgi:hypothetical protein
MRFNRCRTATGGVMTRARFAVFTVVAANYQPSMPRSPQESSAADARRTKKQRQRPLFSTVFGNISAAYDGRHPHGHDYIKLESFCQSDTCHFRIHLAGHYPSLLSRAF